MASCGGGSVGKFGNRGGGGEDLAIPVDEIGDGQRPDGGLRGEEIAEALRLRLHQLDRLVDVLGHGDGIGADHLAMLLEVGGRHVDRVLDDRLGADREPMIEAAVERDAGKDGEQDRRHDRDHAEQADDADMKLGACHLSLPGEPKSGHLPGDDDDHRQHEHEVDEEHAHHHAMRRHDGGEPGQDQIGGKARAQRQHHGDQAKREGQAAPGADGVAQVAGGRRPGRIVPSRRGDGHGFARATKRQALGRRLQGLEDATQPHSPALP